MANVVITDTTKAGWVKIVYNDYYPLSTDHAEQYRLKSDITAIDIIQVGTSEVVAIMNSNSIRNYYTNMASTQFFTVDSVNGVAPSSVSDLRDKLLALL